jgi:CHAT domain-containing protein
MRNLCGFDERFADPLTVESYDSASVLEALCALKELNVVPRSQVVGAEHLSLAKGLVLEVQTARAALETDPHSATRSLRGEYSRVRRQLDTLAAKDMSTDERGEARKDLQRKLSEIQQDFSERQGLLGQVLQDQHVSLSAIAQNLPANSALLDLVEFTSRDFKAKPNVWREPGFAAYVTFPLAEDSTDVVVERVDLGEAAPIDEAVELICRRMGAGQFRAKDLAAALQRLSELVYAPLARHLTNVSHLIVCPDGQLSRVPFEMLLVSGRGEPPRYLVEEKTVSYVGSGREVARLAQPSAKVTTNAPVVMGNPDFDLDLSSRSRREEALASSSEKKARPHPGLLPQEKEERRPRSGEAGRLASSYVTNDQSLVTSAATKFLSRAYRGFKFAPLPGSEAEARNVARLLGGDAVLRLGKEAREAELKAVVSPRVLHLATHGFFLADQEFKRTNARPGLLAANTFGASGGFTARRSLALPENDWENPMVRCGIALAGANHATNPMTRSSRREEAQTNEDRKVRNGERNQIEDNARPHPGLLPQEKEKGRPRSGEAGRVFGPDAANDQSLLTSAATRFEEEDGLLTGLEASLLNLQGTELVILSACESGAGEVKIGEGVMSLRRAFRIAGAETVLASHWKVSDQATSRLMTEFMRRWRAGEPRAKAWREAQLALLRSEKFSNPYFWAAFTLTGQWR